MHAMLYECILILSQKIASLVLLTFYCFSHSTPSKLLLLSPFQHFISFLHSLSHGRMWVVWCMTATLEHFPYIHCITSAEQILFTCAWFPLSRIRSCCFCWFPHRMKVWVLELRSGFSLPKTPLTVGFTGSRNPDLVKEHTYIHPVTRE